MRRMVYTNTINNEIISHENKMLALYLEKIKKYLPFFEKRGYSLKAGLMWKYFSSDAVMFQRESFRNGYECYVYCEVQENGKEVCLGGIDGEADYYPLSAAWMVSSIFRRFFKINVELYSNTDDADTDLNHFLLQLKYPG